MPLPEGPYLVSNLGRVRGADVHDVNGYWAVNLRGLGKHYVHHLVMSAFEGDGLGRICHAGDKKDNRLFRLSRRGRRLTKEEQNAVRARLRDGARPSDVAREFGLSTALVAYYRRRL